MSKEKLYSDVQKLEPGERIEMFSLDARPITGGGTGDIIRFHGYTQIGSIWWQGSEYGPWPIQAEGFEMNPQKPPQPTLSVGNVDGSITSLCLSYQDMVGAVLTRHRTLGKYLDAANFDGGNPDADPDEEFPPDVWYVEQKLSETPEVVQFALSSALDFGQVQLPRRKIIANYCSWAYRSAECGYTGPAVAKADDTPTSNPEEDVCGKRLSSCRLRFGEKSELPFGGYPAASLTR